MENSVQNKPYQYDLIFVFAWDSDNKMADSVAELQQHLRTATSPVPFTTSEEQSPEIKH